MPPGLRRSSVRSGPARFWTSVAHSETIVRVQAPLPDIKSFCSKPAPSRRSRARRVDATDAKRLARSLHWSNLRRPADLELWLGRNRRGTHHNSDSGTSVRFLPRRACSSLEVSAICGVVNVYRAWEQGLSKPFSFHCDNDQCEVILEASVAEADHLFLNCGKQFGGAQCNVATPQLNQSSLSEFLFIRIHRFG